MEYRFDDVTVACTNVDRVVFPESEITKGDVLAYYRDVAELMVPHLRGRALTLERFTKGIDEGGFYQKHFQKHYPSWIDRFEMGTKTKVVYPVCDSPAALVYFANQGGIAFHVGTNRKDTPARPDQIVFDLDPPEGRFDLARRAARAVRDLMTEVKLRTFVKTTGSKGLHVVVPIGDGATYDDVFELCRLASAHLVARHPDLLTTEFYKKDRGGRLFLDTMRNALGATVVAPYSLRGKPGAPVSAPLAWDELDVPDLRPDGLRLGDIAERLARAGDPWVDVAAAGGSVMAAIADLSTAP